MTTRVRSRRRRSLPSTSVMRLRLLPWLLPLGPSGPPSLPSLPSYPNGCTHPHPSPSPHECPQSRKSTPPPSSCVGRNWPSVPSFSKVPHHVYLHHCPFAHESTPGSGHMPCPVFTDHLKIPGNGRIVTLTPSFTPSLIFVKVPDGGCTFCLPSRPRQLHPHAHGEVSVAWLHC